MRRIAPQLSALLKIQIRSQAGGLIGMRDLRREIRALLAVARAAQRQADHGNNWPRVLRALDRLDRMAGRRSKRG